METNIMRKNSRQINIVLRDRHYEDKNSIHKSKLNNERFFMHIEEVLSPFIGLEHVKETIKEIYATYTMNEKREQLGLKRSKQVLHMMFKGNPGTGKTTIARKLAKLYADLRILSKGHFIETSRADLVGEYIGQTAQKTKALIQKAMGGILFIDEAYSLARGGEKDFGKEAIDTIVKLMEDHHHDIIIIMAGYPQEMERFLRLNPGLKSRFPFSIEFPDYNVLQLINIAKQMATSREYYLTKDAVQKLQEHLYDKIYITSYNFSNARYIRNIIEEGIRKQAIRLIGQKDLTVKDLMELRSDDFVFQ